MFGYKHFLTTISYLAAIYYFRRLSAAIYYYAYILLWALPYCDFTRIEDFSAMSYICGLKAKFENINLLPLNQFYFFFSSMVSSIYVNVNLNYSFENAFLLKILKCWKCEIFLTLRYKWFTGETIKPIIYIYIN